jgi:hypothetical protein
MSGRGWRLDRASSPSSSLNSSAGESRRPGYLVSRQPCAVARAPWAHRDGAADHPLEVLLGLRPAKHLLLDDVQTRGELTSPCRRAGISLRTVNLNTGA